MDQSSVLNGKINILYEKLNWLKHFFEHTSVYVQRSADLLFRATQIPRDSSWHDSYILDLVESTDQKRKLCDELYKILDITIIKDINKIIEDVKELQTSMYKDSECINKVISVHLDYVNDKKKNHLNAWLDMKCDPWTTERELKSAISKFITEKEKVQMEVKSKVCKYAGVFEKINEEYNDLFLNFFKIFMNHHVSVGEVFERFVCVKRKNFSETFYDFEESDTSKNSSESEELMHKECSRMFVVQKEALEGDCNFGAKNNLLFPYQENDRLTENIRLAFDAVIEEVSSEVYKIKQERISKDIKIRKYGIFRYKKGYGNEWKVSNVILTENDFLHAADFETILDLNQTLKDKYANFIKILLNVDSRDFLGSNEQNETVCEKICQDILKSDCFEKASLKGFPLNIKMMNFRINKQKYEIYLEFKKLSSFADLFISRNIKLRPFILKDAYDLYFGLSNSLVKTVKNEEIKEERNNGNELSEVALKLEEYTEENPWID
ncbi:hypothetical protein CWI36_0069p0030 [Hamiltosporidium magnivora]|uniref:DUF5098 domain-containing protein n=2 Tax=Hamiltosporidium magnivora TaxID=148818 RepID=A0A4Q9LL48_9MICR|nr:hypothetical protein CWI36_0069p0030 [Hamiltosporidium magnivora]